MAFGFFSHVIFHWFLTLRIWNGKIKRIDINAFSGLPNITPLLINNCELKKLPKLNTLKRNLKSFSLSYKSFSLSYNNISDFSLDYFHGFMFIFGASRNSLTSIPAINELASHPGTLELMSNRIADVEGRWRGNDTVYESLTFLGLGDNQMTSIDAVMIKALPSIRLLDLTENLITHFEDPTEYLLQISSKYTIALSENPLACSSHLVWVVSVRPVVVGATCNTPACVTGIALEAMSEYILHWTANARRCPMIGFYHNCSRFYVDVEKFHSKQSTICDVRWLMESF